MRYLKVLKQNIPAAVLALLNLIRIKDQEIKQVEVLKALKTEENKGDIKIIQRIFLKDIRTNEIQNETNDIEIKKKYAHDYQQYVIIRSFGDYIYTCKASIVEAEEDQINQLGHLVKFNNKSSC